MALMSFFLVIHNSFSQVATTTDYTPENNDLRQKYSSDRQIQQMKKVFEWFF